MTFNVRFPSPNDGENAWEKRRELLVATVREKAPDVMGTQELFYEQAEYIVEKLPAYAWFGVSRRGNREDEHMGVFYKKDRLRLEDSGNFWLSETPDVPGSMSWDVSLPRMVTWGLFAVRSTGRKFYFYNTHFPHRREDDAARLRCAEVIRTRLRSLPVDATIVLTGDFNAPANGEVYKLLTDTLTDAWETAAHRTGPQGTFHGFGGKAGDRRIDWILHRGSVKALEAETVTFHDNGRYPSDHFPVLAVIDLLR